MSHLDLDDPKAGSDLLPRVLDKLHSALQEDYDKAKDRLEKFYTDYRKYRGNHSFIKDSSLTGLGALPAGFLPRRRQRYLGRRGECLSRWFEVVFCATSNQMRSINKETPLSSGAWLEEIDSLLVGKQLHGPIGLGLLDDEHRNKATAQDVSTFKRLFIE